MSKDLTQKERLVKLETLMNQVLTETKELRNEIRKRNSGFVAIEKHQEDIADLKQDINELKSKRWVQNILSAILGATLSLLIAYFISTVGK